MTTKKKPTGMTAAKRKAKGLHLLIAMVPASLIKRLDARAKRETNGNRRALVQAILTKAVK